MSIVSRGLGDVGPVVTDGIGISEGGLAIYAGSISSLESVGSPRLSEIFGLPLVIRITEIKPKSIKSAEKFGKPKLRQLEEVGTTYVEEVLERLEYPISVSAKDLDARDEEELLTILAELI